MSVEGPYKAVMLGDGEGWACIGNGTFLDRKHTQTQAEDLAMFANQVHRHALAAQAERVRELEESVEKSLSLVIQLGSGLFMQAGVLRTIRETLTAALSPAKEAK